MTVGQRAIINMDNVFLLRVLFLHINMNIVIKQIKNHLKIVGRGDGLTKR